MPRIAALPNVAAFDRRVAARAEPRSAVVGGMVVGIGAVTAGGLMAGSAAVAAAWLVAASFATNPHLQASAPAAFGTTIFGRPHRRLAAAADLFDPVGVSTRLADAPPPGRADRPTDIPNPVRGDKLPVVSRPTATDRLAVMPYPGVSDRHAVVTVPVRPPRPVPPPLPRQGVAAPEARIPLPLRRPSAVARLPAGREAVRATMRETARAAPRAAAPEPLVTASISPLPPMRPSVPERRAMLPPAPTDLLPPAGRDAHTAIYDIVAHTVYLPDGSRLEAHSGLGPSLDDPRSVKQKGRGPTPPNVYDLTLRQVLFHGVRAIRLNPADDGKMFGRDGILAHTYMLGPSGQSFGCVSFKDYQQFLQAFLRGEVNRLVVVAHRDARPTETASAGARRPRPRRYAF